MTARQRREGFCAASFLLQAERGRKHVDGPAGNHSRTSFDFSPAFSWRSNPEGISGPARNGSIASFLSWPLPSIGQTRLHPGKQQSMPTAPSNCHHFSQSLFHRMQSQTAAKNNPPNMISSIASTGRSDFIPTTKPLASGRAKKERGYHHKQYQDQRKHKAANCAKSQSF